MALWLMEKVTYRQVSYIIFEIGQTAKQGNTSMITILPIKFGFEIGWKLWKP